MCKCDFPGNLDFECFAQKLCGFLVQCSFKLTSNGNIAHEHQ